MTGKTNYPYIITLKNESTRYVNIIGLLLSVGSTVLFLREMIIRGQVVVPYLTGIIFIVLLIAWTYYSSYKNAKEIYYSKALLIAGLVWAKMPYFQWMIFVFALLAILEYQAKLAPEIGFSEDHIIFNGLLKKKYKWREVENVILKDGLLTVDLKNNILIQKEVGSGENEASEEEFNNWVRKYL